MIRSLLVLLFFAATAQARIYTTTFPLTENPISEGGVWLNGQANGTSWKNARTTPGFVFGTQSGSASPATDDTTAVVSGAWGPTQTAAARVRSVNQQTGSTHEEVELRLRTTITAGSITGYEIIFACRGSSNSPYIQIVKWNGPLDSFSLLDARPGPGINNGDLVSATISGNTISAYVNGTFIFSATDSSSPFTTGSPGVGFYIDNGAGALDSDFGFTDFFATDETTRITDGSSTSVQNAANAASDGDVIYIPSGNFTWASTVNLSGKGVKFVGAGAGRVVARSTTSTAVGTGSKTFTVAREFPLNQQTIQVGQTLTASRLGGAISNGSPTGVLPAMTGTVTAWNGTNSLTLNVTSVVGSGTHPLWILSSPSATTITDATSTASSNMLQINEDATHSSEVRGIRLEFSGTASDRTGIMVFGLSNGKPVLLHDCYLSSAVGSNPNVTRWQTPHGIIWNNSFNAPIWNESSQGVVIYASGFNAWTSVSTMGMNDSTGTNNLYIEACDFHAYLNSGDLDDNAKVVVRDNLFNNSGFSSHGADTSNVGARHYEFYDNTFIFNPYSDGNTLNLGYYFFLRGGTGLFTNNFITDIFSQDYGQKAELSAIVMNLRRNAGPNPCWGADEPGIQYPAPRQIGMGRVTGTGTDGHGRTTDAFTYVGDSEPMYIWNNTGFALAPGLTDYDQCTNPDSTVDYFVQNRDYFVGTAKPGWSKYTYPHPLRPDAGPVVDTTPPTLGTPAIDAAGTTLSLPFSEAVQTGSGGSGGWTLQASGGAATLTFQTGSGSPTILYTISRAIQTGESVTVSYTQPGNGIEDLAGNDLASLSNRATTNGSTQGAVVATPVITLPAGTYTSPQSTTITDATSGAVIHYTTNGTTPTGASATYSTAISIPSTMTVKAIATKSGSTDSAVASSLFTINIPNPPSTRYIGIRGVPAAGGSTP